MHWGRWSFVVGFLVFGGVAESSDAETLSRGGWEAKAKAMVVSRHRECAGFLVSKYTRACKTCWPPSDREKRGDPPIYTFLKEPVRFRVGSHPLSEADQLNGLKWRGWVKYRVKTYGASMERAGPIQWSAGVGVDGKGEEFIDEFQATDQGLRIVAYQDGPEPDSGQLLADFTQMCTDDFCLQSLKADFAEPTAWTCDEVYELDGFPKKGASRVKP